jgi:uncharacterized membrane protein YgdD (TMEM256/DUF423 family)
MGIFNMPRPGNAILNNTRAAMDPSYLYMPPVAQIGFGIEMIKTAESVQQIESMQANVRQMQAQQIVQAGGANTNLDSLQRNVIYRWTRWLSNLAPFTIIAGVALLIIGAVTNKLEWINKTAAAIIAGVVGFMATILFITWGPQSVRHATNYNMSGMLTCGTFGVISGVITHLIYP